MLKGNNKYCGPAVIAELLKTDTDTAAQHIRWISGQRAVRGAYTGHLLTLIQKRNGITSHISSIINKPCWQIVKSRALTLLVVRTSCGGSHFMLAERSKLFDNHSKQWVKAKDHIHRNAIVKEAYEICRKPKKSKE